MNRLVYFYIIIFFLILGMGLITFTIPIFQVPKIPFRLTFHFIFEGLITFLAFLIFLRANYIYSKSKDPKMAIIAGGFLAGFIFKMFHIISTKEFPYDVFIYENIRDNKDIFYLILGDFVFSVSIFMSIFYAGKQISETNPNFRRKTYLSFIIFGILIMVSDYFIRPYLTTLMSEFPRRTILFDASLEVADKVLFILSAFIYSDIKLICDNNMRSNFIIGLLILGIGQIFFITPNYLNTTYAIIAHSSQLTGFLFILSGLNDIVFKPECLSFRHKLSAYLALFLMIAYLTFISLGSVIFGIRFPSFGAYVFLEFFLITTIIQYVLSARIITPINNIIKGVEKYRPSEKPEHIHITSQDEIGRLTQKINEIADLNWRFTQELISRQEQDRIRLSIMEKVRSALSPDEILTGLVSIIGETFKPDQCMIYDYDPGTGNAYTTKFEYRESWEIPSFINLDFTRVPGLEEIYQQLFDRLEVVTISDVKNSNLKEITKDFFKNYGINGVFIIPITYKSQILGVLALHYLKKPYNISQDMENLIKSLEPQISQAIYQVRLYSETNEYAKRESLLRNIANLIASSLNIEEIFETITEEIGTLLKVDKCIIRLYNSNHEKFEPIAKEYRSGLNIPSSIEFSLPDYIQDYYNKLFVQEKRSIFVDNINTYNINDKIKSFMKDSFGVESFVGVPILHKDKLLSILIAGQVHPRKWAKEEIETLVSISDQLAIAIYQSQLFDSINNFGQRERALREIAVSSISSLDIKEILSSIVTRTGELFKADRCFFTGYDATNKKYLPIQDYEVYIPSLNIKYVTGLELNNEEMAPFTKIIIEQRRTFFSEDVDKLEIPDSSKQLLKRYNIKSAIGAPVYYRDIPLGMLVIHYVNNYREFSQEEIDLLSAIANQAAIVIHQAKLFKQIQETGNREGLLRAIINQVLESENLEKAVESIVSEVGKLFNADRCALRFYDTFHKSFSEVVGEFRRNEKIPSDIGTGGYPKELDDYFTHELFENNKIFVVKDINNPIYPKSLTKLYGELHIKSTVISPIFYKGTPIAAIFITNTETTKSWDSSSIDLLPSISQQISIGINLFRFNDRLKTALDREKSLREIIIEIRSFQNHDQIFNYALEKASQLFNVKRCIHLHFDEKGNLYTVNEYIRDNESESFLGQVIFCAECIKPLLPLSPEQFISVNDVDEEITNPNLKDLLKSKGIQAFILYPTSKISPGETKDKVIGVTLLCSTSPRKWTMEEMDYYKLFIDAVSIVNIETSQRNELEKIRQTFIATLTHDLRSPIISEQKALEFMTSRNPDTPIRAFLEYLDDIHKTNEELLRIVNNILAIYHIESGQWKLNIEPNDINNIINDAVRALRPLARDQDSEIETKIQDNLPSVMADKNEITRVLINLISNAIRHNKKGTNITVSAQKIDKEIQIAVSDNGSGIPESARNKIFQRYPTEKRLVGTGLGLFIAKQIIEEHNGKIWFESQVGKGTTFYFTLPVA